MAHWGFLRQSKKKCSLSFVYYLEFLSGSVEMELISFVVVLVALTSSAQIQFSS